MHSFLLLISYYMLLEELNVDVSVTAQEAGEKAGRAVEAKLVELQSKQE